MEAIKCPNCGSEKVQELTEAKYVCTACDNVFLIHNLSKEFRMTDEHITEMHGNIARKLDEIKNVSEAGDSVFLKEQMANAELLLEEDVLSAYEAFKKITMMYPNSAIGYEGMFRAMSDDYTDNPASYLNAEQIQENPNILYDGFDVLMKALKCKDVSREELLTRVLTRHKTCAKHVVYKNLTGEDEEKSPNGIYEHIDELITLCEEEIRQTETTLQSNRKQVEDYETLSKGNKIKKFFISKIPSIIFVIIGLIVGAGFWRILLFLAALICLFAVKSKPADTSAELQKSIEDKKNTLDRITKAKEAMKDIDDLTIDDMEKIINENYTKGDSVEEMYVGLRDAIERKLEAEAELAEGFFQVEVQSWGRNPRLVRDILKRYCDDGKYIEECYRNNSICRISGFRKSGARQLQEELIQMGAVTVVRNI